MGLIADMTVGMGRLIDARVAFRLPIILAGAQLDKGRRNVAGLFRAAGVGDNCDCFYDYRQSVGRNVTPLLLPLLIFIVKKFDPGAGGV